MMKIFIMLLTLFMVLYNMYSSLLIFILMFILCSFFMMHNTDFFVLYSEFSWDTLSLSLISLSVFIFILMLLSSISNKQIFNFVSYFNTSMLFLLLFLILTFSSSNMIMFYIMFEASLIPTFILILGWGNQPERSQAGMYMLIYTVLASLPLLVAFLIWSNKMMSMNMHIMNLNIFNSPLSSLWALTLILAFSVKLPTYMVHLWLPKAHVEAPVAGSMVLAAILLKLGGYGMLRVISKANNLFYSVSPFLISWSIMGGVMVAMTCVYQNDIKFLIALSSVAHMSLIMASILTFSQWGVNGTQFIMIGHGFCSSGLFCMANIAYERVGSRSFFLLKGLKIILPSMSIGWFMLCTSNMAAPPSLNLLGEMNSIMAVFSWSYSMLILLAMLVFLSAAYSLFLFSQTQHGKLSMASKPTPPTSLREWLLILAHWLPLNILILSPSVIQIMI